jgi:hypothetical protein
VQRTVPLLSDACYDCSPLMASLGSEKKSSPRTMRHHRCHIYGGITLNVRRIPNNRCHPSFILRDLIDITNLTFHRRFMIPLFLPRDLNNDQRRRLNRRFMFPLASIGFKAHFSQRKPRNHGDVSVAFPIEARARCPMIDSAFFICMYICDMSIHMSIIHIYHMYGWSA